MSTTEGHDDSLFSFLIHNHYIQYLKYLHEHRLCVPPPYQHRLYSSQPRPYSRFNKTSWRFPQSLPRRILEDQAKYQPPNIATVAMRRSDGSKIYASRQDRNIAQTLTPSLTEGSIWQANIASYVRGYLA